MIDIKKFYKRDAIQKFMFGHVYALYTKLPASSVDNLLIDFMRQYGITEDDVSVDTLRTTYYRMLHEFQESLKTENQKPNNNE